MGRERYVVRLEREERDQLERLIRGGKSPARKVARARILLKADTGWGVMRIVEALHTSAGTVCRGTWREDSGSAIRPNWMSGGKRTDIWRAGGPSRP